MPQVLDNFGKPIVREQVTRALSERRAARDRVRARYDAAATVTENELHWANSDSLSAVSANSPEVRQKLRDRSRYEAANNTYCAGMIRTFATDVIGTGPRLQMNSGDRDADSQVEMEWWKWTVATRFADKLRTMRMAQTRDGESFGVFITNMPLRNPVKLDLRLYEAEQFALPIQGFGVNRNFDGIIFDDFGNPVAYNLLDNHPGGTDGFGNLTLDSQLIAARNVLHLFRSERPGQVRGIPEITAALPLYAQLRRYTLAVIAAAETAADIAAFIQTSSPTVDPATVPPLDLLDIQRRMLMTVPEGWNVGQLRAEQPATTYAMFKREIVNEIARVLGMPYNIAAGDSSAYNFASGRLDHKTYFKLIRVDRSCCEVDALDPTFSRWWEEARMLSGVLPDSMRVLREPAPHTWGWDGDEHIDPQKEANAQKTRLENGTTTYAREFGAIGLDWEDEFRQRAREEELRKELGLAPEQVSPQQPDPEQDSEEAIAQRIIDAVLEEIG